MTGQLVWCVCVQLVYVSEYCISEGSKISCAG